MFHIVNLLLSCRKGCQKKNYDAKIINVFGEWEEFRETFAKYNIEIIDLNFNYYRLLPKKGFLYSRLSYLIVIILSIIPLFNLLKKDKITTEHNELILKHIKDFLLLILPLLSLLSLKLEFFY